METVKIKDGSKEGFAIINKADFDEDRDELFTKPKVAPPKEKAKKASKEEPKVAPKDKE